MIQRMVLVTYIYTCGHMSHRSVPRSPWSSQPNVKRMPDVCTACFVLGERDAYMRELQVRAAFEAESG